jgi:Fur family transcriptional regulator, ferric uptake regulator
VTVAPEAPPRPLATVEEALEALRALGMRVSTPRRLVLEGLFAAAAPVSAIELARSLSLDATSVYRNLEMLERHGLVRHVHLGHGPGLYALPSASEVEYLYCEGCGALAVAAPEQLEALRSHLRESFGYEARFSHFALVGRCADCLRSGGGG